MANCTLGDSGLSASDLFQSPVLCFNHPRPSVLLEMHAILIKVRLKERLLPGVFQEEGFRTIIWDYVLTQGQPRSFAMDRACTSRGIAVYGRSLTVKGNFLPCDYLDSLFSAHA